MNERSQVPDGWSSLRVRVPATLAVIYADFLGDNDVTVTKRDDMTFASYGIVSSQELLVRTSDLEKVRQLIAEIRKTNPPGCEDGWDPSQ